VVVEGGVFSGSGVVSNNVTLNHGTHAPGASPGVMRIKGNYTLASDAVLQIEINGTAPGTQYDQVCLNGGSGTVTLAGTLQLVATNSLPIGSAFTIITNTGSAAVSGAFAGLPPGYAFYASGYWWRINYSGGNGEQVTLTIIPPPAPSLVVVTTTPNLLNLMVTGEPGHAVDLYTSTNLSNWSWVTNSFNTTGALSFAEPIDTDQPARFYRAVLLP
jgi:fibronectin-binding autotransporter adhesin